MDFYKTYKNLQKAFIKFIDKTPPIGKSIICIDDLGLRKILNLVKTKNFLTYGFNSKSNYQIRNVRYNFSNTIFDLEIKNYESKKKLITNINLNLIGKHNVLNATSAIAVCLNLGVKANIIKKALKNFSGVQRRLTKIFVSNKKEFYDDYAHHPTEIKSVLNGLKQVYKKRKLIAIFQPHRYSRIKNLKKEFSSCFTDADVVLLCPVYAAGEKKDIYYDSNKFCKLISKFSSVQVIKINNEIEIKKYLSKNLINDEIIIGMGAGSISKWMNDLKKKI